MEGESKITVWEPPHRLRLEWGGSPLEYRVEDGKLHLSNATSNASSAECLPYAWPLFLSALSYAATHEVENVTEFRMTKTPRETVFARLMEHTRSFEPRMAPGHGYASFESADGLLCIFNEQCGSDTGLTLSWLATSGDTAGLRQRWSRIADEVTQ